jgi:ribosomal protein S13
MLLITLYNKKKIKKKIFGLGFYSYKMINAYLGLKHNNNKLLYNNLYNFIIYSVSLDCNNNLLSFKFSRNLLINKILSIHFLDYNLKINIYENIKKLIDINSYKGFCHKNNLPVNGQRTKTNRYTQRILAKQRLKKPKKIL